MLRGWNRSRGSDSIMAQLQDLGAMAEAGDDVWRYLSLRQKQEKTVSMKKLKVTECDKINLRKNKCTACTREHSKCASTLGSLSRVLTLQRTP